MPAELWGNSPRQWLLAGGAWMATLVALLVLRRVLVFRLGALAQRTTNAVDDLLVDILRATRAWFLAVVGAWVAGGLLLLSPAAEGVLRGGAIVMLTLQVALWGTAALAGALGVRARRLRTEDPAGATTLNALGLVARLGLYLVLALLMLDNLGVNVSALVAGLGIGGVAIALATQNILGDLFASLSIVLDKPFVVGDFIVVGELMGTIEQVGLKTTRVRSLSGEQLIFANADLLGSRIRNFKRMTERRVQFTIGVTYQTPFTRLSAIPALIRSLVAGEAGVRFDRAHFKGYDDSALTFEVVYYVLDPDYNRFMDIQQRINFGLFRSFEREGIEFAYPTRTVYLRPAEAGGATQAA